LKTLVRVSSSREGRVPRLRVRRPRVADDQGKRGAGYVAESVWRQPTERSDDDDGVARIARDGHANPAREWRHPL